MGMLGGILKSHGSWLVGSMAEALKNSTYANVGKYSHMLETMPRGPLAQELAIHTLRYRYSSGLLSDAQKRHDNLGRFGPYEYKKFDASWSLYMSMNKCMESLNYDIMPSQFLDNSNPLPKYSSLDGLKGNQSPLYFTQGRIHGEETRLQVGDWLRVKSGDMHQWGAIALSNRNAPIVVHGEFIEPLQNVLADASEGMEIRRLGSARFGIVSNYLEHIACSARDGGFGSSKRVDVKIAQGCEPPLI